MDQETIPFWSNNSELRTYPSLDESVKCDVCIIGAGISGLTTAYLLAMSGKKVVIIDDGPIGGGQTWRTTGHLASALDDRYYILESYFGEQGAKLAAQSHNAAIDFIESLVKKHHIACEFERVNAYLFAPSIEEAHLLEKELDAAKRAGLDVAMVSKAPLKSFETGPAVCFSNQAHFHTIKYLNKLCELIEACGGAIYCDTHAASIKELKDNGFTIETNRKKHIHADHVVVATNYPTKGRIPQHFKQAAYRTYVIAGNIPEGYVKAGLYYDTLDPYHYIRTAKDKDGNDILIAGGEDHRTGEEEKIEERYQRLEAWTRERFPLLGEISYRWSGQIIEPIDCLGFIGRTEKDRELYMITGDSGNGLTHGTIGGLLIHDLILGIESPWEKLYDPHRLTFKAAPRFIEENTNTVLQYRDWVTSGEKEEELGKSCGVVVRKGVKKCAIYRDENGKVHEMSAICPHLGAIVRWNQSEHCWECPAHGSRFDALGKVIQGPANCRLNKKL